MFKDLFSEDPLSLQREIGENDVLARAVACTAFVVSIILMCSIIPGVLLASNWTNVSLVHALPLPDPAADINPLLHLNNISLSLHRCVVPMPANLRSDTDEDFLFHFYSGMPEGLCPQLLAARAIYPDYVSEGPGNVYAEDPLWGDVGLWWGRLVLSSFTFSGLALLFWDVPCLLLVLITVYSKRYKNGVRSMLKVGLLG